MSEMWDIPSAIALYNIDRWGTGYFTINGAGNVQVMPTQAYGNAIDLMEVVTEARKQGMAFPLVVRFQDLLRHRVETINRAFQSAIAEANYQNTYKGVFPIKVNQLREVIEEVIDAGGPFSFGLEAGSKPELIAALAVHRDPESLIICNGYKDSTFIQNALLGRKLGKQVIMVVEKLEEVRQIVQVSKEMNVMPMMGLRVRHIHFLGDLNNLSYLLQFLDHHDDLLAEFAAEQRILDKRGILVSIADDQAFRIPVNCQCRD